LLLIIDKKIAYALLDEINNHRPWMTFKVTDNQYGRLS